MAFGLGGGSMDDKDLINKVKEKVFKYDYLTGCIKEKGIIDPFSYKIIFDEPEDKLKPCDTTESLNPPPNKSTKILMLLGNKGMICGNSLYLPPI